MACTMTSTCLAPAASARVARPAASKASRAAFGRVAGLRVQTPAQRPFAPAPVAPRAAPVAMQAVPQEVAQVALETQLIWSTAGICFAMTLVGIAIGFVLLRVESLVEEGKL